MSVSRRRVLNCIKNALATFSPSSQPCQDFFFQLLPGTSPSKVVSLLQAAWQDDPLTALKLVFHLRSVRGRGKSDKEAFYAAGLWMLKHHPLTLIANLWLVPRFGYFKDLLELLQRELDGEEETSMKLKEKQELKAAKEKAEMAKSKAAQMDKDDARKTCPPVKSGYFARKGYGARLAKKDGSLADRETRIVGFLEMDKAESESAFVLRKAKRDAMASRAKKKYSEDLNWRALYVAVARVFAEQLILDKEALDQKKFMSISLAAKWTPSIDSSYDLRLLMCEEIARKVFPKEKHPEYDGLEDQFYAYRVRDRLRKEILVPLREALKITEVYMSARRWEELPYSRVPSVAMKTYTDVFNKHDGERFNQYMEDVACGKRSVASGKRSVASGVLLPHTILKDARSSKEMEVKVAELQWQRMVKDLKEGGSQLKNSLAVCDVTCGMDGAAMEECIALGLLIAEMSEEPWKNRICTFSENPELHAVQGTTLRQRYDFTREMGFGVSANFQKIFDNILEVARASKLSPEKMIRRLFVFSDIEFDEASENPWETDYMAIMEKFAEAGYGEPPQIVFWNLKIPREWGTAVLANQKGVALLSGYSNSLLRMLMEDEELDAIKLEKEALRPVEVMRNAIAGELFEKLKVVD